MNLLLEARVRIRIQIRVLRVIKATQIADLAVEAFRIEIEIISRILLRENIIEKNFFFLYFFF